MLAHTPREIKLLMRADGERRMDDYERMAHEALMNRQAQHEKKLKLTDLYKRPNGGSRSEKTRVERLKESTRNANDWLAGLTAGKGVSGKE